VQETSSVDLSNTSDSVHWMLEPNGRFSVSSLYQKINQGPSLPHEKLLWNSKLPLKIKIFLWQMAKGRLPSNARINRRHGASDGSCALLLSPYFGQIRRWAAIKMGLEDIRAIHCWIGLARGFGLNCPCICIIMLEYDSV
jgi:hypothetical protein